MPTHAACSSPPTAACGSFPDLHGYGWRDCLWEKPQESPDWLRRRECRAGDTGQRASLGTPLTWHRREVCGLRKGAQRPPHQPSLFWVPMRERSLTEEQLA